MEERWSELLFHYFVTRLARLFD